MKKTLQVNNLKSRTAINAKIPVFVICVEVIIYLLLLAILLAILLAKVLANICSEISKI